MNVRIVEAGDHEASFKIDRAARLGKTAISNLEDAVVADGDPSRAGLLLEARPDRPIDQEKAGGAPALVLDPRRAAGDAQRRRERDERRARRRKRSRNW